MIRMTMLSLLMVFSFFLRAQNYKEPVYTVKGFAIKGYDAVAFFTLKKGEKGSEQFSYDWKGSKWLFSSKENLDLFKSDTETYAPQYGGYCAWGMKNGYKAKTDPANAWIIHNGKLYLNYNQSIKNKWLKDKNGYIKTADENWKKKVKE